MDSNQERKEALFEATRQLASPAERLAYLDTACGDDAQLRRQVEVMLEAEAAADQYFRTTAAPGTAVREAASPTPTAGGAPLVEGPGTVIGRYKLLQQVGEGGFGVVYLAEQQAPVVRQVALKVIKLGMDTKQVIARFEAERQALALMDHPHIAKILDGGATETGRPYFVMELVQGVPITTYCDQNNLSPAERLGLFLPVCQAVQHAHQKGIIHRDLKPSNVLVKLKDGVAHPMVIDFGVAKALNQRLTEKTLFTNLAQMMGTPAYMSPEQAEMGKLDVDTRSDVYSLGVLLYELLTGTTPFPEPRLRSAGWAEMQRIIVEEDPPRPSTRLSTLSDAECAGMAQRRRTEARKLVALVRGELDWIVMKCLEKDRTRRYATVNGLAMDLQRYLHDEPVLAAAPSARYLITKFVRRHRTGLAVTTALFAMLLAGMIVSTWQMLRARKAERLAEQRLREVEQERQRNEIGTNSAYSVIGGGFDNHIANNAPYAVIPGGRENHATNHAFAAGYRAKANHSSAFVWADSQPADFLSATNNEFAVRAAGGVRLELGDGALKLDSRIGIGPPAPLWPIDVEAGRAVARFVTTRSPSGSTIELRNDTPLADDLGEINFNTWSNKFPGQIAYKANDSMTFQTARAERLRIDSHGNVGIGTKAPTERLHVSGNIYAAGAITPNSDRKAKTGLAPVDTAAVLAGVARLPLQQWRFLSEAESVKHLGPTAQDFRAAFDLGAHDTAIATVDADGVALAAIQGLNQKVEAENRLLREALDAKAGELHAVKQRLVALEERLFKLNLPADRSGHSGP